MMKWCSFQDTGKRTSDKSLLKCVVCRRVVASKWEPSRVHFPCAIQTPGPGDYLALWLAHYGITKHNYNECWRWIYAKLGLPPPKPCKCTGRQQKINSLYFDAVLAVRKIRNALRKQKT